VHSAARRLFVIAGFATVVLTAQSLPALANPLPAQAAPAAAHPTTDVCGQTAKPGMATCFAIRQADTMQAQLAPNTTPKGYGPADLRSAYNLTARGRHSATVAIVDAYDDPKAESDLATYRSTYGLPACTTANGCFKKVNQNGQTSPLPAANSSWASEISLDVDMVSAICPNCRILLVEANAPSLADLGTSVNTAVSLGAKYVSNSYGGAEDVSENSSDTTYFHHPGIAITASTGDSGYGIDYPASSAYVTAVGGTLLTRSTGTRGWSESAWSGAATRGDRPGEGSAAGRVGGVLGGDADRVAPRRGRSARDQAAGADSNVNAGSGYAQKTFDVSSLAGQTVTITFTGTEDASLQTSFVVDDTALTLS
jgi:hypothetical protein